jgi:hypothetical protein
MQLDIVLQCMALQQWQRAKVPSRAWQRAAYVRRQPPGSGQAYAKLCGYVDEREEEEGAGFRATPARQACPAHHHATAPPRQQPDPALPAYIHQHACRGPHCSRAAGMSHHQPAAVLLQHHPPLLSREAGAQQMTTATASASQPAGATARRRSHTTSSAPACHSPLLPSSCHQSSPPSTPPALPELLRCLRCRAASPGAAQLQDTTSRSRGTRARPHPPSCHSTPPAHRQQGLAADRAQPPPAHPAAPPLRPQAKQEAPSSRLLVWVNLLHTTSAAGGGECRRLVYPPTPHLCTPPPHAQVLPCVC